MKKNPVNKIILIVAILLILSGSGVLILANIPKKIAFYNFSQTQQEIILNHISNISSKKYKAIELDSNLPLSRQAGKLKGISLLFAVSDADNLDFALNSKQIKAIPQDFFTSMPSSFTKNLQTKENGFTHIPFLYDMYQIDVNFPVFEQFDVKNINTWKDIMKAAEVQAGTTPAPFIIPFGEDKMFLDIFGQLYEVRNTFPEYEKFYAKLYENFRNDLAEKNDYSNTINFIKAQIDSDFDFKHTMNIYNDLIQSEAIRNSTLNFTMNDTLFYCDNELTGFVMCKLSDHRKIAREVINHYKSIYTPSLYLEDDRKFAAIEYSIFMGKENKETLKIIGELTDNLQYELCCETGLAPVQKTSETLDHQADDVRYWLAASSGPMLPLSSAIPDSSLQKKIAEMLRP